MIGRWIGVVRQVLTWLFTAVYVPGLMVVCLVTSPKRLESLGPKMVRTWGKIVLGIAGTRVEFAPGTREILNSRAPRILSFNHASTLDVPLGASLLPDGGVLVVKEEMRKMPFMGAGLQALGSIFLDRRNRESAYASLEDGARKINSEQRQVFIAPEGTRSADGSLGPFKRGAFHLSHLAEIPITPVVLHGCAAVWPMGQFAPTPGTVWVEILEPFPVPDGSDAGLNAAAEGLRKRYEETLHRGPL